MPSDNQSNDSSKHGNKNGHLGSDDEDEDSNIEMALSDEKNGHHSSHHRHLHDDNHSEDSNDSSLKGNPSSPLRQPLDCIPVETVLQEQALPDGTTYLNSQCFASTDNPHCASPDQASKRKFQVFFVLHTLWHRLQVD